MIKDFRFIDLFAGIWWFHIALKRLWWKCVFASEINTHARKTYIHNFYKESPDLFNEGFFNNDITQINNPKIQIPDFDVLCWWFPCQPFSQAWFKKWFEDARGTLFFNIAQIIKEKQPEAFFLENVRWLLTHNGWQTFAIIKKIIEEDLGYSFYRKIIKASDYWLPQIRPRLFMVWFRNKDIAFSFPNPIKLEKTMSDIFDAECDRKVWFTLRCWWRWSGLNDRRNRDSYFVEGKERRLTPKEWKRMQWFPDDFEFPVSETQAMKQLWNSVAINAIQAVAQNIILSLYGSFPWGQASLAINENDVNFMHFWRSWMIESWVPQTLILSH